ncbi:MAG: hypothetical protein ACTSU5_12645 [Promethearchaeota archaeon]
MGLSATDIWKILGRNNPEWGLPFWSMWEYSSGFVVGGLMAAFYLKVPPFRSPPTDHGTPPQESGDPRCESERARAAARFIFGHLGLFLYGLGKSLTGAINHMADAAGSHLDVPNWRVYLALLVVDVPLYFTLRGRGPFERFGGKPFREKCLLLLVALLPVYYALQFVVAGTFIPLEVGFLVTWADTISVVVVEAFLVFAWRERVKSRPRAGKPSRDG